ncbi:MAG TPA: TolC family protein, partial [Bryobacterales bacterium]|nr:TolC family protein [Bryobacterales bacterium]
LVGFYFSPDLDVARAQVRMAEAAITTAGARPNPSLSIGGGYSTSPESALVFHFTPNIPIETAGKRGLRILEAQRQVDVARLALAETGWHIRSAIRAALAGNLFAMRERDLLAAEQNIRAETVKLYEQRLAVGEVSRPDVDAARTDFNATALALQAAEGRIAETRASLAAALGVPVSALDGITLTWRNWDQTPAEQALPLAAVQKAGLLNRIDVQRLLAEYAVADAALRLEIARQYPDIDLGPGYDFDEGHDKFAIGPALALPIFNRNQGPIAEAEARRNETAARFVALQAQAIGEIEKALAQYRSARAELSVAGSQVLDLQQAREAAAQRAFAAGEIDRLALDGMRVQTAVAERARLTALAQAQAALGALEQAVQQPLEAGLSMPPVPQSNPRPPAPAGAAP